MKIDEIKTSGAVTDEKSFFVLLGNALYWLILNAVDHGVSRQAEKQAVFLTNSVDVLMNNYFLKYFSNLGNKIPNKKRTNQILSNILTYYNENKKKLELTNDNKLLLLYAVSDSENAFFDKKISVEESE